MRRELFEPSVEGEARLLLLISAFSSGSGSLEGWTKLAKLDFFLRYPEYLRRAVALREPTDVDRLSVIPTEPGSRMVRYRYGPWDPAHYAIVGRLLSKGLVQRVPYARGVGFKATDLGIDVAKDLRRQESWSGYWEGCRILKKDFNLSGARLKEFIYRHFPEVAGAEWGERL